ncbi:MAG: EAL domain-containing protein [Alphaproteobacteria bacterium]|nr:EAL domain-containing protein [Alphaproteobacteria bacterium]
MVMKGLGAMHITHPHYTFGASIDASLLHYDPLTGLPDRRGLSDIVGAASEQAAKYPQGGAYFVAGIDHMQRINRTYGLEAGHDVLRHVALLLATYFDDRAHICWLGGDTFGIVVPDLGVKTMAETAEAVLEMFRTARAPAPLEGPVLVSLGGIVMPSIFPLVSDIVHGAESAMQKAKDSGRNCFASCRETMREAAPDANEIAALVRTAIADNKIQLAWQPIVESSTGEVLFYEALARLSDEAGRPLSAAAFIPVVEQLGLSYAFDCKVLALAVEELKQHPSLQLSINVSGYTAAQPGWSGEVQTAMAGRRDISERLIIEITETADVIDFEHTTNFIAANQAMGGRTALDDFGAGFTSIKQLRTLPVQIMKLDRALVTDLLDHHEQQVVIRSLVALARGLGLRIVAEGVEDQDVADWLSAHHVDYQQGYHHGRPQMNRPWAMAA